MAQRPFEIGCFSLGVCQTNCYVLHPPADHAEARSAMVIDPGQWPDPVLAYLDTKKLTPAMVVLTHGHMDHIMGLDALRERWPDLPILIHPDEAAFLTDPVLNLSAFLGEPYVGPVATGQLNPPGKLHFAGHDFELRHTPGHSPGSVSLYLPEQKAVIAGDALFRGSIGRYDFPGGSLDVLSRSIREQLYTLPSDTIVYPGHGPETTIGYERRTNPFVKG